MDRNPIISNALINPSRRYSFDAVGAKSNYADTMNGSEWILSTNSSCDIQMTPEVREILEQYHIPYLRRVLGRDVARIIYTQDPVVPVKKGQRFMATMMKHAVLPPNLKSDPEYLRCADLVERIWDKNGCYLYALENGLAHTMCPTIIYKGGILPDEFPFPGVNWVKFAEEKKGIPTVRDIDSADPKAITLLHEFLKLSNDDFQIQKNFPGIMRSPHYEVTQDEVILGMNPISIIDPVTRHHTGSYFPVQRKDEPTSLHSMEFLQQIRKDGFFGFANPDVLQNTEGKTKSNEKNIRPGGSEFPSRFQQQLGYEIGTYGREEVVDDSLSTADVYRIVEEEGGYVYLPGNLARRTERTVGVYVGGPDCEGVLVAIRNRLKLAA